MNPNNWPIIAAAILVLVVAGVFLMLKRGKPHTPDYRTLFIIGVTWIPLGLGTGNHLFTAMGVVFMTVGLANKGKWKERTKWRDLDQSRKNLKIALLIILTLLFVGGVAVYLVKASV